jgi:carboxyl-terminal processing protease
LKHISIQLASASALTEQQVLVDDVWREVTRQFVDKTYNGLGEEGWRKKRLEAVKKVANVGPDDTEVVYSTIRTMLNALGDPYTRFLAPDQYESLTSYARGGTLSAAGIGVQLLLDPTSGGVVVLSTVQNGPAAKAGVLPGDVILEVDGMDVQSATAEVVAVKCRGDVGSTVTLAIRHGSSSNNPSLLSSTTTFALTRAEIKVSPVESSTFVSDKGKKVGLIKLSSFNQETASQVMEALNDVKSHGASSIVIDIRGNAGGYMPAGVDVAKLFLPPQSRVISEVDRMDRATIYTADGIGSDTTDPLYLLVDDRTASASEILTAALQDNHRAIVVGPSKTFGKGRIQNVQGLEDGSGIAVTKAKYITPSGRDIHGIGILPDNISKDCGPNAAAEVCLTGLV